MRLLAPCAVVLIVCGGCAPKEPQVAQSPPHVQPAAALEPKKQPESDPAATAEKPTKPGDPIVSLTGPGGKVSLGDDIEQAKRAFPPPAGAQQIPRSMSFAILGTDGWCWTSGTSRAFEVAARKRKIVAISLTDVGGAADLKAAMTGIGKPTRKAEGKTARMYVWDSGESARFWLVTDSKLMPKMTMTLVGKKEDLKLLNYRAEDPESFVKILDMADANSGDFQKQIEDAKRQILKQSRTK